MPLDPDAITRADVRAAVAALLGELGTVHNGQIRPTAAHAEVKVDGPLLSVLTPRTRGELVSRGGAPQFRKRLTVGVEVWATGATDLAAYVAADELLEAVERAVLTDDAFVQAFEPIEALDTTVEADHEAATRMAHGLLTFDVVWVEEYRPASITSSPDNLETVHVDLDVIDTPATSPDGEIEHSRTLSDLDA